LEELQRRAHSLTNWFRAAPGVVSAVISGCLDEAWCRSRPSTCFVGKSAFCCSSR